MIVKLLMGLRNNRQKVEVIKIAGQTRPVLGTSYPQEDNRRKNIARHWGNAIDSPRPERLATIDEPLPQRTQTILSHQIESELRRRLDGGGTLTASRQPANGGAPETAPLGTLDQSD
jgi:hypothetical protein